MMRSARSCYRAFMMATIACTVVAVTGAPAGAQQTLSADAVPRIIDLGTLGGKHSFPYGINNDGTVVESSSVSPEITPCAGTATGG